MAKLFPASAAGTAFSLGFRRSDGPPAPRFICPIGVRRIGVSLRQTRESSASSVRKILCQASEKEKVQGLRRNQIQATELFAELLKADDVRAVAQKNVEVLTEDFFMIASTYLDLAKKEGNVEVVTKLETTLQTTLSVKEATLRPEIRLLNQLLRQKIQKELTDTIQSNAQYLQPDSYFFQLLKQMISDVEKQTNDPRRMQLLAQLRYINKETNDISKAAKKTKGFGAN